MKLMWINYQTLNEKYQEYLGITPTNDADGILQDTHWSFGNLDIFLLMQ